MNIKAPYQKRPVRFLEVVEQDGWSVKLYSIAKKAELVSQQNIMLAKKQLSVWLQKSELYPLETYQVATLILHEGKEGCFAIISWWIDENMMQLFVYLAINEKPDEYVLFSDKGIVTCVWEMAVLWFERNAWVECVLKNPGHPEALQNYLRKQMNEDV